MTDIPIKAKVFLLTPKKGEIYLFVRYHGDYSSPKTKQPYGIFVVIYHLHRDGKLSESDSKIYLETKDWFEGNLPNPPFYEQNNNAIRAVTWFKENNITKDMLIHMNSFLTIADKYGKQIIRSQSYEVPGKIVYEDEYQIAVMQN